MGIFSRLFKVGQSQAHAVVDKLEDPIKLTEQGIRDLKSDLQNAMTGLAEVKGVSIRLTKEAEDAKRQADEYERKAMLLLQRFKDGQMDQAQADRLATEALNQKELVSQRATKLGQDAEQQQRMATQLQDKVQQLKTTITTYEQELITLRGRAKTAESTKKINQHLAQAYGEVGEAGTSVDTEINKALAEGQPSKAQDQLQAMKARLGITS